LIVLVATIALTPSGSAQVLLAIDVNDREIVDTPNTPPGFSTFQLSGTAGAVGSTSAIVDGFTVSVTAVNASGAAVGGIDDRDRVGPSGPSSLNQLYDDFIFTAAGVGIGGGIDLTIGNNPSVLLPNTQYVVSIYSYDRDSTLAPQPRTAAWLDGNNGDTLLFATAFSAAAEPATDDQYKFTGIAVTDAAGTLFLRGRNTNADTTPGVFVNGIEIRQIPEPSSALILAFGLAMLGSARTRRAGG
jgi:hypothetical protein